MKSLLGRLTLLATALAAVTMVITACVEGPVQPGTGVTAAEATASFTESTAPVCENLVYPPSLCSPYDLDGYPGQRAKLCSALRTGSPTFSHPVVGSPATEVFKNTYSGSTVTGSRETVTIPRPKPYPPRVLYFTITTAQIEQPGMCAGV